jgi:hypothetical protein
LCFAACNPKLCALYVGFARGRLRRESAGKWGTAWLSPIFAFQIETEKADIRNQREHHKRRGFEQEFVAMLKKARVPYDPKIRVWMSVAPMALRLRSGFPHLPVWAGHLASRAPGPNILVRLHSNALPSGRRASLTTIKLDASREILRPEAGLRMTGL